MRDPEKLMVRVRCSCWSRRYFQRYGASFDYILPRLREWIRKGSHDNPGHQLTIEVRELAWRRTTKKERELRSMLGK
jgi:hypothetical protein